MRKLLLGSLAAATLAFLPLQTASAQYYHPHYHRGWNGGQVGAAIGAGVLGGALIAGAMANGAQAAPAGGPVFNYPPNTRLGYCERHLPGFDVTNGTYIDPYGRRARCP